MSKVNVYAGNGDMGVIAKVEYNANLDHWDGSNWTCGSTGRHLGLTQLRKSKEFVLIHGTQWQGERDYAEIVSPEEAFQAVMDSGNEKLLEKFPELCKFQEELDTDNEVESEFTTIQVSKQFKYELDFLKEGKETYQEVLQRVVKERNELLQKV